MKKKIRFINGYSESAWKSLVVKSLRVGWVQGLEAARQHLSKSAMDTLLISGLFEDTFPAGYEEMEQAIQEIRNEEYFKLCQRETHHGRGYTNKFCDMEKEAVKMGKIQGMGLAKQVISQTSLTWLNPRIFNCLYTWWYIQPKDRNVKRTVLDAEFEGIPEPVLDSHTYEGKRRGNNVLMLSGHYEQHRAIGQEVMKHGWERIRKQFITSPINPIRPKEEHKQASLF